MVWSKQSWTIPLTSSFQLGTDFCKNSFLKQEYLNYNITLFKLKFNYAILSKFKDIITLFVLVMVIVKMLSLSLLSLLLLLLLLSLLLLLLTILTMDITIWTVTPMKDKNSKDPWIGFPQFLFAVRDDSIQMVFELFFFGKYIELPSFISVQLNRSWCDVNVNNYKEIKCSTKFHFLEFQIILCVSNGAQKSLQNLP